MQKPLIEADNNILPFFSSLPSSIHLIFVKKEKNLLLKSHLREDWRANMSISPKEAKPLRSQTLLRSASTSSKKGQRERKKMRKILSWTHLQQQCDYFRWLPLELRLWIRRSARWPLSSAGCVRVHQRAGFRQGGESPAGRGRLGLG